DIEREFQAEQQSESVPDKESESSTAARSIKQGEGIQESEGAGTPAGASQEDISLYNDELMPYSFRWWLYKTRLEHADTYQPFASPELPRPKAGQVDFQKIDEAIL